ncbi:MAG: sigma-70 family RNA polymerase sigma factor [Pirellulales bacterium]|nr:sigma-70 family RNA polymerase sigma factor [Pirellulales bacterium]
MHETVLERIAAGEPAAVDECLARYGPLVWSLARRHLKRHVDAEDAVQEVFIDVWRSAARFDPGVASEATFISMLARRRLIDRARKHARTPPVEPLAREPAAPSSDAGGENVDAADEARRARLLMDGLRTEQRRVLQLSLLEGLTHSEVAARINMPLGTVKTHSRRGLMRLRAMLETDADATKETLS